MHGGGVHGVEAVGQPPGVSSRLLHCGFWTSNIGSPGLAEGTSTHGAILTTLIMPCSKLAQNPESWSGQRWVVPADL